MVPSPNRVHFAADSEAPPSPLPSSSEEALPAATRWTVSKTNWAGKRQTRVLLVDARRSLLLNLGADGDHAVGVPDFSAETVKKTARRAFELRRIEAIQCGEGADVTVCFTSHRDYALEFTDRADALAFQAALGTAVRLAPRGNPSVAVVGGSSTAGGIAGSDAKHSSTRRRFSLFGLGSRRRNSSASARNGGSSENVDAELVAARAAVAEARATALAGAALADTSCKFVVDEPATPSSVSTRIRVSVGAGGKSSTKKMLNAMFETTQVQTSPSVHSSFSGGSFTEPVVGGADRGAEGGARGGDAGASAQSQWLMAGWLIKQGGRNNKAVDGRNASLWKRRWFMLRADGEALFYQRSPEGGAVHGAGKGVVNLRGVPWSVSRIPLHRAGRAHTMALYTPARTYYLAAESESELEEWLHALRASRRAAITRCADKALRYAADMAPISAGLDGRAEHALRHCLVELCRQASQGYGVESAVARRAAAVALDEVFGADEEVKAESTPDEEADVTDSSTHPSADDSSAAAPVIGGGGNDGDELEAVITAEQRMTLSRAAGGFELKRDDLTIGDKLAEGFFGEVFRGTLWGGEVAVKRLKCARLGEKQINELRHEVEIMASLRHPNVVLFMGACTTPPHLLMCTEFMASGNLYSIMDTPADDTRVLKALLDICKGLIYLHRKGIIHRDLSKRSKNHTRAPHHFLFGCDRSNSDSSPPYAPLPNRHAHAMTLPLYLRARSPLSSP